MDSICIDDLCFSYGEKDVLNGISVSIKKGSLVGILGPNGCGKTTLLRCVSGYLKPKRGSIKVEGREVSAFGSRELSRMMALVPQHAVMEFDFTVRDIVLMGRNPHQKWFSQATEEDVLTAESAMRKTGVLELADRSVLTLSGGEWQRAIVARALCQQSSLMLLDEPVSNLDIKHQIDILRMVKDVVENNGITAVCVLHDINLAAQYCSDILMLKEGKTYLWGSPCEVISEQSIKSVYGIKTYLKNEQNKPYIIPDYNA